MEKFVFTKKVSLGFIKKNAMPGQVVSFSKNYAMFQNEKITDFRDFEILKRYGFLIPSEKASAQLLEKKQQTVKINDVKSNFGFQVKHEKEQTNIIPLDKFLKPTQLDQNQVFIQEDGVIVEQPSDVHVAQVASTDEKQVENVSSQKKEQVETTKTIKKQAKTTNKKTTKTTKKSTDTVRGMKVIKES